MSSYPPRLFFFPRNKSEQQKAQLQEAGNYLYRYFRAGLLEKIDLQVASEICFDQQIFDPEVMLAAAVAVAVPRHGHVCVDLSVAEYYLQLGEGTAAASELAWPAHGELLAKLQDIPFFGRQGSAFVLRGARLYSHRYFTDEVQLAQLLRTLSGRAQEQVEAAELASLQKLLGEESPGDMQQEAVLRGLKHSFFMLTGGPGMGKTYTVRSLLVLLYLRALRRAPEGGFRVALVAPTGKAAARMGESLKAGLDEFLAKLSASGVMIDQVRDWLLAQEPQTIHRLLGVVSNSSRQFRYRSDNPLALDLLILDEASMVDLSLMMRLLSALAPQSQVILIGDRHQLASVEAGSVLADLCQRYQGQPQLVELSKNYRFGADSAIGRFARLCLQEPFSPEQALDSLWEEDTGEVRLFSPAEDDQLTATALAYIEHNYRALIDAAQQAKSAQDAAQCLQQAREFRVLCPLRRGPSGLDEVNRRVEALLSPSSKGPPAEFWPGRLILVTQNSYAQGLFNGDVGIVVHRENDSGESRLAVAFENTSLNSLSPVRYIPPQMLPPHETCFAQTIHKSQGSEYEQVFLLIPQQGGQLLTRELIYTAVTRAKTQLALSAQRISLGQYLQRRILRASGLAQALG